MRVIYQNVCPILAEDETTTEETTESKFASAAEDVLTMVKGAKQLREGVREAEEVKDVLLEPPVAEADKKQEKKKVSHFQAMALMGKLFFGLKTKAISEEAEDEETSYEEDDDDDDDEEEEEEGTETESDVRGSGESGEGHVTKTQVQVVIEKEDSSRERSPPQSQTTTAGGVKTITHFQAVTLLTHLFAKVRAQHNDMIARGAKAASGADRTSSSEWTEPLSASDPSTETGASSPSSRYVLSVIRKSCATPASCPRNVRGIRH